MNNKQCKFDSRLINATKKLFFGMLILHGLFMAYRFMVLPKGLGYPWYGLLNNRFDQILFMLLCIGSILFMMGKKYRMVIPMVLLFPLYIFLIIMCVKFKIYTAPYILPFENNIFLVVSSALFIIAHACGITAGTLAMVVAGSAVKSKTNMMGEKEKIIILIHKLIRFYFPFFITGVFFHWLWAYTTQGVLWRYAAAIMVGFMVAVIYAGHLNLYAVFEKSEHTFIGKVSSVIVSIIGLCMLCLLYR